MDTITYTSARSDLAKTMERVCDDHAPIIITRKNAKRLLESIAELESGKGTEHQI